MNGKVDEYGRALLPIALRSEGDGTTTSLEAWVDTGFTGDLMLPRAQIKALGFTQIGDVNAGLGDGRTAKFDAFEGQIDWFGQPRKIDVLAHGGKFPLLGVKLLAGHVLTVDYEKC